MYKYFSILVVLLLCSCKTVEVKKKDVIIERTSPTTHEYEFAYFKSKKKFYKNGNPPKFDKVLLKKYQSDPEISHIYFKIPFKKGDNKINHNDMTFEILRFDPMKYRLVVDNDKNKDFNIVLTSDINVFNSWHVSRVGKEITEGKYRKEIEYEMTVYKLNVDEN